MLSDLKSFKLNILFPALVTVIITVIYLPVLNAPFLLDDYTSIVDNSVIRTLDIGVIYRFSPMRFIGYLTIAVNFSISKLDPLSYHIVNIIIHILFTLASFCLFQMIWRTPAGGNCNLSRENKIYISIFSALLIAVHPMNTFAVSYIIQRLAALTALFYVTALIFYIQARLEGLMRRKILFGMLSTFFTIAALFTKQNAFSIFPQLVLIEFLLIRTDRKKKLLLFCGLISLILLVLIILSRYNFFNLDEIREITRETPLVKRYDYFLTQLSVIPFYLKNFLYPSELVIDYAKIFYNSLFTPQVYLSALFLISLFLFIIFQQIYTGQTIVTFGVLFYFTAISIESSFIPIRDAIFIHRNYLPLSGIALSASTGICILSKKIVLPGKIKNYIALSILIILSVSTVHYNLIFKDPIKVWTKVIELSPQNKRACATLGALLLASGDKEKALHYLTLMYHIRPDYYPNLNNLGILYRREKKYDKAIEFFKKAVNTTKRPIQAYSNLGMTYVAMKKYDLAINAFLKAYDLDNHYFQNLLNIGYFMAITSGRDRIKLEKALLFLEKAEEINNRHPVVYYAKSVVYYLLKNEKQARLNAKKAVKLRPELETSVKLLEQIP